MQRFILHIGPMKTGSTSIQEFFLLNREHLRKNGIYIPVFKDYFHSYLAEIRAWPGLIRECREAGCRINIITCEHLATLDSKYIRGVRNYLRGHDVKVVLFARRYEQWLESAYLYACRMGRTTLTPDEWASEHPDTTLESLERWGQHFGKENMRLVPFGRESLGGRLEDVFIRACDLDMKPEYIFPKRMNETPKLAAVAMLLRTIELARKGVFREEEISLIQRAVDLAQLGPDCETGRVSIFSPQERYDYAVRFADNYEQAARQYLGREDGMLFREPLPDASEEWKAPLEVAHFTADDLTSLMMGMQVANYRRLHRMQRKTLSHAVRRRYRKIMHGLHAVLNRGRRQPLLRW